MDLGSANVRLVDGGGRRLAEASVLAVRRADPKRVVACGDEARRMEGRAPTGLELVHPIHRGAIADYDAAEALLRRLLTALGAGRSRFRRARPVLVAARWQQSQVDERAIEQALANAGAGQVHFLAAPLLAAAGLGLEVRAPRGRLIVDIGAEESSAAVVTAGGIARAGRWAVGGAAMDEALVRWFRQQHGLVIGRPTAEGLKKAAAAPGAAPAGEQVSVAGVRLGDGLPAVVTVPAAELTEPLLPVLDELAENVARLLGETPPELLADVWEDGGHLVGGVALMRGLADHMGRRMQLRMLPAENAPEAVADGLQAVLRGSWPAQGSGSVAYRTA
ncbi:MAG: rod shape-determining protein [Bacillota bacterium]|nr:rod shape-determining protein [Bacillota bacterium]